MRNLLLTFILSLKNKFFPLTAKKVGRRKGQREKSLVSREHTQTENHPEVQIPTSRILSHSLRPSMPAEQKEKRFHVNCIQVQS